MKKRGDKAQARRTALERSDDRTDSGSAPANHSLRSLTDHILRQEQALRLGGGDAGQARQRKLGRLPVRERIGLLLDTGSAFLEIGLWAAYGMYDDVGGVPAAGVVTGIGSVCGRDCMIVANDATVKAGAFFPATAKKVLRAQRIAGRCNLPLVYLVDSAGVYLPMQDEIFPDEDDFGRIFRNNAVLSAAGVPQIAAIMGNCVAGGAYLPVLCDKLLMTEGSALYLAGPALVKAAIGEVDDDETLGGVRMHSEVSGTVDFREPNDEACIARVRELVGMLGESDEATERRSDEGEGTEARRHEGTKGESSDEATERRSDEGEGAEVSSNDHIAEARRREGTHHEESPPMHSLRRSVASSLRRSSHPPTADPQSLYDLVDPIGHKPYDAHALLAAIVDGGSGQEYKADYGKTLLCAYARISGRAVGVVANQRIVARSAAEGMQVGGVIYHDAADKAARFIMDCSQAGLPLVFFQDVRGFMVGREAERHGTIRSGAKLVNAVSNATVPKITVVVGGSFGAGNYALCGKAFDPAFIFAWPGAQYAVMGGDQAADTLLSLEKRRRERDGSHLDEKELRELADVVKANYERQTDIRYGAARGWVDAIIAPHTTREALIRSLAYATRPPAGGGFRAGVLQV